MPLVENSPKTVITDFVKLDIVADHDPAAATEITLMDDAEVDCGISLDIHGKNYKKQ